MVKNVWKKGLVLGIILLFVGASVTPSISGSTNNVISEGEASEFKYPDKNNFSSTSNQKMKEAFLEVTKADGETPEKTIESFGPYSGNKPQNLEVSPTDEGNWYAIDAGEAPWQYYNYDNSGHQKCISDIDPETGRGETCAPCQRYQTTWAWIEVWDEPRLYNGPDTKGIVFFTEGSAKGDSVMRGGMVSCYSGIDIFVREMELGNPNPVAYYEDTILWRPGTQLSWNVELDEYRMIEIDLHKGHYYSFGAYAYSYAESRDEIVSYTHMHEVKFIKMICAWNDENDPYVPPGGDQPDETFDISTPRISINNASNGALKRDIAVLFKGFPTSTAKLLEDLDEHYAFVDINFADDLFKYYPIFMIPSGGLYGLDSSSTFKSKLENYVDNGGTLIVFTQQHGYEYKALPGNVGGFGWLEDQSCHHNSVYMDTYHQILSSQDSVVSDAYVDGSFTSYPENASVLLSRTKNGMPALLMYNYGNGTVIASTLYTDWAYPRGQATKDGINIVRDIINWAKNPMTLRDYNTTDTFDTSVNVTGEIYPEFELGETVNISVNVTNLGNVTADKVSFKIFEPFFEEDYVNISVSIPPQETTIINFTYPTTNSSEPGIYYLFYLLYANETLLPPGQVYVGPFIVGINLSTISNYTVNFTLINPDNEISKEEAITVNVPPGTTIPVNFSCTNLQKLGIWRLEYITIDFNGISVESGAKKFAISKYAENPDGWVYQGKDISFIITTPDEHYMYGSDVPFTIHVYNHGDSTRDIDFNTYYKDWGLRRKLQGQEASGTLNVPAHGNATFSRILHTGSARFSHNQLIIYGSFSENSHSLGRTEKVVYLQNPLVKVQVETDKLKYVMGKNVTAFMEFTNKRSSTYDVTTKIRAINPHNTKIFEDSLNFTLTGYETRNETITFPLPIPSEYGLYLISADTYSNERKIGLDSVYFEVDKPYKISLTLDKPDMTYNVRENMSLDIEITNIGYTYLNSTINISIPVLLFEDSIYVSLNMNETQAINYNLDIPELTPCGKHDIIVTIEIDNTEENYYFIIPNSLLNLNLSKTSYDAKDYLNITLKNIGGVDTTYISSIKLIDSKRLVIYENESVTAENISVDEIKTIGFQIPGQVTSGKYRLTVNCEDLNKSETTTLLKSLTISGLEASLTVSTNKTCYFKNETIGATINISNLNGDIENATMYLKAYTFFSPHNLDLAVTNSNDDDVSVLLGDGSGGFGGRQDYPAGQRPYGVVAGDFDSDGDLDLAVTNYNDDDVSVLLNNGFGGFGGRQDYPVGDSPYGVVAGDFDSDGDLDLAVTNYFDYNVSVLLNNGFGGFGGRQDYPAGDRPYGVVAGDFDSDGDLDLAVTNGNDDDVSVLLNNGSGGFGDRQDYPTGQRPYGVVAGDFDSDDDLDLAVTNGNDDDVSVLLNNGSGGFGDRQDYPAGNVPYSVVAGDFDSDDDLDLAVTNYYDDDVSVLLNNGSGGFGDRQDYPVGIYPRGVVAGDFDSDDDLDLAVTNRMDDDVSVLLGDGFGGFGDRQDYPAGDRPYGVVAGDFDSDDDLDLAVTNAGSNADVSVFLGDGSGGFGDRQDYPAGNVPYSVVAGDFDSDDDLDLAVTNYNDDDVSVLLNNGFGGFGGLWVMVLVVSETGRTIP